MEKTKHYPRARYSADTLKGAIELFWEEIGCNRVLSQISVDVNGETWSHDDLNEFLADYRRAPAGDFAIDIMQKDCRLRVVEMSGGTRTLVKAPARGVIEKIFSIFETGYASSVVPLPPQPPAPPPVVFIGHGKNPAWRDLKDHLQDKHGFEVVAYETGARAGHTIRDILDEMAEKSTIAFLVLTAEDEQGDGQFRARQNVIHETGLFQGRLGFSRAIALIENGTEPFSNLQGIDQIRFASIKETFGEVLATIKREMEHS